MAVTCDPVVMASSESDRERAVRRLRDAAITAVECGADVNELAAALREGVNEGRRLNALRAGTPTLDVPVPRRPEYTPEPGSAVAELLQATRAY